MKAIYLLLFALIFTTACNDSNNAGPESKLIVNSKPGAGTIAVLGDSLANGYGTTKPEFEPTACLSQFPGTTRSWAVDGATSAEILARVPSVVASSPKLVFVSSGGNDAIQNYYAVNYNTGSMYPPQKTMDEMSEMFDTLQKTGALVVYLGLNPPMPGAERLLNITTLAKAKGVLVVDGMNGVWQNTNLMSDEFHPNDAGYKIMCDRIVQAISPYYP